MENLRGVRVLRDDGLICSVCGRGGIPFGLTQGKLLHV
jgi:hypothetical protein